MVDGFAKPRRSRLPRKPRGVRTADFKLGNHAATGVREGYPAQMTKILTSVPLPQNASNEVVKICSDHRLVPGELKDLCKKDIPDAGLSFIFSSRNSLRITTGINTFCKAGRHWRVAI